MIDKLTPEQTAHLFKVLGVDNADDALAVIYRRVNGLYGRPESELRPSEMEIYAEEKSRGHAFIIGSGNDWYWYGPLDAPAAAGEAQAIRLQDALAIIGETLEQVGEDEDGDGLYKRVKVTG